MWPWESGERGAAAGGCQRFPGPAPPRSSARKEDRLGRIFMGGRGVFLARLQKAWGAAGLRWLLRALAMM